MTAARPVELEHGAWLPPETGHVRKPLCEMATIDEDVVAKRVVNGTVKRTHPVVAQLFGLVAGAVLLAL